MLRSFATEESTARADKQDSRALHLHPVPWNSAGTVLREMLLVTMWQWLLTGLQIIGSLK